MLQNTSFETTLPNTAALGKTTFSALLTLRKEMYLSHEPVFNTTCFILNELPDFTMQLRARIKYVQVVLLINSDVACLKKHTLIKYTCLGDVYTILDAAYTL